MTKSEDTDRLEYNIRLSEQLSKIVSHAELVLGVIDGAADVYIVPLGDIDAARSLLLERAPPELRAYYETTLGVVRLLQSIPIIINEAIEQAKRGKEK